MNHELFMREALKEAQLAYREGEIPIGAIIVAGNKIIAKAHNQTETLKDVTAHAEILAITAATNGLGAKYLKNCTLYVTIEPCPMCAGAIYWSQIEGLVFGAKDHKRGFQNWQPTIIHPKTEITSGILENECADLMKKFFMDKR